MTFQPGHNLSPGRRPGSRNKRTAEIFNRLESRGDTDPADLLSSIVTNPQEAQELRIQAAGLLMPYKYGKHGSIPALRYIDDALELRHRQDAEAARHQRELEAEDPLDLPPDLAEYQTRTPSAEIGDETPAPGGELHSVATKEPDADLEDPEDRDDNVGDLPEELEDPPDPVPELSGRVYPQPTAISLNKE